MEKLKDNRTLIGSLILFITLLWGYAWVLMKESLQYMGPFTFSSFRFGVGAITLLLVAWILKLGLPPKKYWKHIVIVGILQTAIVFLLVMYALRFVDAGKSSVLLYSMPMWSSLLAVKFLNEKLSLAKSIGLFIGMLGLLTILGWDIWIGQSPEMIIGEILIILAAVSWAVANTYYRLKLENLSQIQVSAFQMFFGALAIMMVTLFMEHHEPLLVNSKSVYYILFTGVFASALCFTLWFLILSLVDMVTATISTLLVPMFGLLFSSFLLGEKMTFGILGGSGMIIIGIIIAQKKRVHDT
ncbi:EamA family transporter [Agaribacter marinus]|uniref:DMT family transporter n=2 Tax=Bacillaceae TaxID=186817 RepID=A0A941DUA7_9BACI|nr:DMT family transporter [Virgibacillus salarius]NAZ08573.1 EamA family transporter [Agaribacter marinus]QRZ20284.1 DMT family transporter [Virgibacillus sp. AGTR]